MSKYAGIWITLLVIWNLLFVAPLVGPVMHESDQASLLLGSVDLSRTGQWAHRSDYNYAKQYGSYWILGALFSNLGSSAPANSFVTAGNLISLTAFTAGLLLLGLHLYSGAAVLLMGCLLLSPSFLSHAPFLASNYLSAFFLCLQFVVLTRSQSVLAPALCAFFATACRADAVLAQPILIWLSTVRPTLGGLLSERRAWFCLFAVGGALGLGFVIAAPGHVASSATAFFFKPQVLAAFAAFGLGAGALVLLLALFAIILNTKYPALFRILGAGCLLFPFLYYAMNMYSTRHWTVALVALMAFVGSPRGQELFQGLWHSLWAKAALAATVAIAVFPVLVGLKLDKLSTSGLTLTQPTLLPSADGLIPTGAYLARAWGWDRANRLVPDHNAALWNAALQAAIPPSEAPVAILSSPLQTIFELALYLQNRKFVTLMTFPPPDQLPVYTDLRNLRKSPMSFGHGAADHGWFRQPFGIELASPVIEEQAIARIIPEPNLARQEAEALFGEMKGDDYHLHRPRADDKTLPGLTPGRKVTILAEQPFTLQQGSRQWSSLEKTTSGGHRFFVLTTRELDETPATLSAPISLVAIAVLPHYMSVSSY